MSFLKSVSRASKGAACAAAVAFMAMSSADAQTTIINDSFADGITNLGPEQLNVNTTSSSAALDTTVTTGPLDFASGDSGRTIHGTFPAQTLEEFGDVLTFTFDFTTPTTIAFDGGTNGTTGSGSVSTSEDFKFGLFDTSTTAGVIDPNTMVAIDFNGPIGSGSSTPNPGLNIAGIQCEIDNINASGTDLGIRTHNINENLGHGFPTGRLLGTNDGFDFIAGGDDDVVSLAPNSDYSGTVIIEYTDETLTSFEITVGMSGTGTDGLPYDDSFTRTVPIEDTANPPNADTGAAVADTVGVNTNTFDVIAFHATTGAFGGTVGPTMGSSTVGEDNNGIDITNVTITFTDASEMPVVLKGDTEMDGDVDFADIPAFIAILQGGTFVAEADCDCSGAVNFGDIPAFIMILQNQ